jgi:hypothetical protein
MRIRRPNAAEVLAVTALVVASSGSAVAASRYLITSSSQIKPSVLREIAHATRGETAEPHSLIAFNRPGIPFDVARADCPKNYEVISGGYNANLPGDWKIVGEERTPTGFVVRAESPDLHPAEQAKLTAIVYCRTRG